MYGYGWRGFIQWRRGIEMAKWLEIGMCIAINVVLVWVIVDDSILNLSGSNFGFLVAFSALAILDLWVIYKMRQPRVDNESIEPLYKHVY